MITNFKLFENDLDPYGEEDEWGNVSPVLVKITPKLNDYVDACMFKEKFRSFIGKTAEIKDPLPEIYHDVFCYVVYPEIDTDPNPNTIGYLIPRDCCEIIK